ncbi:TniQ family protein [Agrobacterium tumefaciens]|uniref:TniQ family protein n=1 Tax=Agrobacterium tumefaciens TaxID=358 RepID=UPI001571698E|nr:TniQ family protein [Agrobacterium tumefaciens]NTE35234.1 hypothetical protein [Agrobacterium tumefaciens]NTE50744.1 hypothetical protein [Agrobacterium tumefaciens]
MLHDQFRAERIFSRWSVRPCFGEPTNAYFARLVYDGEDCLPESFAKKTGIWVTRDRWQILLQALLQLPLTDDEKQGLSRWSPIQSSSRHWALCGENISMTLVKPGARSCAECLKEAEYHRVWWDLNAFQTCPVHDCALQLNPNRHDRRWPFYGICKDKHANPPRLSPRGRKSLEGYILQRLGATRPVRSRPLLDGEPLDAVMSTCSVVGTFLDSPPSRRRPKMSSHHYETGFQALGGGEDQLVGSFSTWLTNHYPRVDLRRTAMGKFGFIRHVSRNRKPLKDLISACQVKACARLGMLNAKLRSMPGVDAPPLKSNLPGVLGVTDYSSNALLKRAGFDLQKGSGRLVEIPNGLVEDLKHEVARSVSMPEAAKLLGCTTKEAELVSVKLAKSGWAGCIQIRQEKEIVRHFIHGELEKLLTKIRTLPTVVERKETVPLSGRVIKSLISETRLMADVLLGREPAYLDPEMPGLRGLRFNKRRRGGKPAAIGQKERAADSMIWSEFFAMTGVSSRGIQHLVEQGVLEQHSKKGLMRKSAYDFHAHYINPIRYLRGQGVNQYSAIKCLETYGFNYAFPPHEIGVVLADRRRFVEKMGTLYKPPKRTIELWPEMVKAGRHNCPSLMIPITPGDGMFDIGPSSRLLSVKAILQNDGIWIGMEFIPRYRRLWKILCDNEAEIHESLRHLRFVGGDDLQTIYATVATIDEIDRVTADLGILNIFFRNKAP